MAAESLDALSIESQRVVLDVDLLCGRVLGFTVICVKIRPNMRLSLCVGNLELMDISVQGVAEHTIQVDNDDWVNKLTSKMQENGLTNQFQECLQENKVRKRLNIGFENVMEEREIVLEIRYGLFDASSHFSSRIIEGISCPQFVGTNTLETVIFPCFGHPECRVKHWSFTIIVPLMCPVEIQGRSIEFQVFCSGVPVKSFVDPKNSQKLFLFERLNGNPLDMGIVLGYLDVIGLTNGPVQLACCPGSHAKSFLLLDTMAKALEFYNWIVARPFPFDALVLVFADMDEESISLDSLVIINRNLLYDKSNIDQTYVTRLVLCRLVSMQYFYFRLSTEPSDLWLLVGLSRYTADLYLKKLLGGNEVGLRLKREMDLVCVMDYNQPPLANHGKPCVETELVKHKSTLVLHMIESKIGATSMIKVLNSLYAHADTENISTVQFLKLIKKISGKDLKEFAEQWIYRSGAPNFLCSFLFNRKRSSIELTIRQSSAQEGRLFVGPLKIRVYEFDGTYDHSVHIEDSVHQVELACHAKNKRSRVKGRDDRESETSLELPGVGSPIAWIRIDPDVEWIRTVELHQPDFMWMEQLYRDKDVISQSEAILSLAKFPSSTTFSTLDKIVSDWKLYYQIRCMAIVSMASIASAVPGMKDEVVSQLLNIFERKFCLQRAGPNDPLVIKSNNFENISNYFVQKTIIESVGKIKDVNGKTPLEIQRFLVNLLKYNDNSHNPFSDYSYLSSIIKGLCDSLVPSSQDPLCKPDGIILKDAIGELERYRFIDMIEPRYHNSVTVSVIQSSLKLQLVGLLQVDEEIYFQYLGPKNFIDVRIVALEALMLLCHKNVEALERLFTAFLHEGSRLLRHLLFAHLRRLSTLSQDWAATVCSNRGTAVVLSRLLKEQLLVATPDHVDFLLKTIHTIETAD